MPHHSTQENIDLPTDLPIWTWLFDSEWSPLNRFPENELRGYMHATRSGKVNWKEAKKLTTYISTALVKGCGLKEGQTVSLFSPNSIWYPISMFSVLRAGGVVSCASPAYNVEEMTYALEKSEACFLITVASSMKVAATAARKAGIPQKNVFLLEGEMDGFKTIKDLIDLGREAGEKGQVKPFVIPPGKKSHDVCAFLSFSSGTTGMPKAVMISHQNPIAQCLQVQKITPPDLKKAAGVLPAYHITGLVYLLHLPILINADVIFLSEFTMENMLNMIVKHQILDLLLVPPILIRLVRDAIADRYDLSCLRRFTTGAAPVSKEIFDLLEKKFPYVTIRQAYGMTESCSCITLTPPEFYGYKYAHTVGTICASTACKIIKEDGTEAGLNEPGELLARGPQITMGYLNNEEATSSTYDKEGYLHTGDQATIDENGLITIVDRIKEMIKVKAIGVAPAELEDLLLGHNKVEDAAVIGIRDDYSGERPKAYVVLKATYKPSDQVGQELMQYVKERKVRDKWIKEVEFVNQIPKSAAGKILRKVLREQSKEASRGHIIRAAVGKKARL